MTLEELQEKLDIALVRESTPEGVDYNTAKAVIENKLEQLKPVDYEERARLYYDLQILTLLMNMRPSLQLQRWYKRMIDHYRSNEASIRMLNQPQRVTAGLSIEQIGYLRDVQLLYFDKMVVFYLGRLAKLYAESNFPELAKKAREDRRYFKGRHLLIEKRYRAYISVRRQDFIERLRAHYGLYALGALVGVVMCWHGIWGIVDLVPVLNLPYVSLPIGITILGSLGLFFRLAGVERPDEDEDE